MMDRVMIQSEDDGQSNDPTEEKQLSMIYKITKTFCVMLTWSSMVRFMLYGKILLMCLKKALKSI